MFGPSDWWVVDLSSDPTPGDPVVVQGLAQRVQLVADDAGLAQRAVLGLAGDGAVTSWFGLAGEVFRGALNDFPGQLDKLGDSYGKAAGALEAYATSLDSAQDCADRALEQGRAAQAKIDSLSRQLSAATATASSAGGTVSALSRPPLPGAEPPDPVQVLAATHNATTANTRVSTLSSGPGGAQDRLTADKNSWGSDGYQGSNSTWRDPHTGQTFEVQVHTPDSLAARESAHSLYEAERVLLLGSPEQLELAAH